MLHLLYVDDAFYCILFPSSFLEIFSVTQEMIYLMFPAKTRDVFGENRGGAGCRGTTPAGGGRSVAE